MTLDTKAGIFSITQNNTTVYKMITVFDQINVRKGDLHYPNGVIVVELNRRCSMRITRFEAERDYTLRHAKGAAGAIAQLLEAGAGLEVDCASVEQADITFVQTLVAAQRSCAARDLPFSITSMSDVVASAFHRAGVTPPGTMPSELSGI